VTESEAVEKLKNMRLFMQIEDKNSDCKFTEDDYKANEIAIQALEKQMAKKIVYHKQSYGTPYRCPECEAGQIPIDFFNSDGTEPSEKYSWCWKCGQKLDWGDAE